MSTFARIALVLVVLFGLGTAGCSGTATASSNEAAYCVAGPECPDAAFNALSDETPSAQAAPLVVPEISPAAVTMTRQESCLAKHSDWTERHRETYCKKYAVVVARRAPAKAVVPAAKPVVAPKAAPVERRPAPSRLATVVTDGQGTTVVGVNLDAAKKLAVKRARRAARHLDGINNVRTPAIAMIGPFGRSSGQSELRTDPLPKPEVNLVPGTIPRAPAPPVAELPALPPAEEPDRVYPPLRFSEAEAVAGPAPADGLVPSPPKAASLPSSADPASE